MKDIGTGNIMRAIGALGHTIENGVFPLMNWNEFSLLGSMP